MTNPTHIYPPFRLSSVEPSNRCNLAVLPKVHPLIMRQRGKHVYRRSAHPRSLREASDETVAFDVSFTLHRNHGHSTHSANDLSIFFRLSSRMCFTVYRTKISTIRGEGCVRDATLVAKIANAVTAQRGQDGDRG